MSTMELKTELQRMIEQETDTSVLKAILILLKKTSLNPILKDKLIGRALKSEEDIQAGRLFAKDDVIKRVNR